MYQIEFVKIFLLILNDSLGLALASFVPFQSLWNSRNEALTFERSFPLASRVIVADCKSRRNPEDAIALRHMRENAPRRKIERDDRVAGGDRMGNRRENPLVPSFDRIRYTPSSFVRVLTYGSFDLFRET